MGLTVFPKQAAGPASTNASRIQGALIDLGPCIGLCIATWPTWRAGVLLIGQCSLPPPEFIPAQEIPRQKFIQQLAVEMLLNQSTVADSSFAGPEAAGKTSVFSYRYLVFVQCTPVFPLSLPPSPSRSSEHVVWPCKRVGSGDPP